MLAPFPATSLPVTYHNEKRKNGPKAIVSEAWGKLLACPQTLCDAPLTIQPTSVEAETTLSAGGRC